MPRTRPVVSSVNRTLPVGFPPPGGLTETRAVNVTASTPYSGVAAEADTATAVAAFKIVNAATAWAPV